MLKYLIGAVVVGGLGYVGYKAYQKVKSAATTATTTPTAQLSPAEMEKAAWLAQKYNEGFAGGCIGCMGASVQIL